MKVCSKCGEEKSIILFKKSKQSPSGYSSWCKVCHSAGTCNYQKDNRDKANVNNKKYKKTEKGKISQARYKNTKNYKKKKKLYYISEAGKATSARNRATRRNRELKALNNLTAAEWINILKNQDNKCVLCGISFTETPPQRDHIHPLSKGGGLCKDNVQGLCKSCNSKKGAKIESDWDSDKDFKDQSFDDLPHFELIK